MKMTGWDPNCVSCGEHTEKPGRCCACTKFLYGAKYYSAFANKGYEDKNLDMIRNKINTAKAWNAITPEEFILARDKWLRKYNKWLMDVENQANERVKSKKKISRAFYEIYINDRHM